VFSVFSTIYKQLVNLYGNKYDEEKFLEFVPIIHSNVSYAFKQLCKKAKEISGDSLSRDILPAVNMVDEWKDEETLTENMVRPLEELWRDEHFQKAYQLLSAKLLYLEPLPYWIERLDKIVKPDYVPDLQDTLRTRAPTTGIVQGKFEFQGSKFLLVDVGGQRNERKKWINCFDGVSAMIFVTSLCSYEQVLFEDVDTNGMTEALKLFDETVNLDTFQKVDVLFFLNKSDLFRERIKHNPLSTYFKDFKGGSQDFEESVKYIQDQFRSRVRDSKKDLYCHVTCATDTKNVEFTFAAVSNIILKKGLSEFGMLS
jgi:GTPase SAR1 family protein